MPLSKEVVRPLFISATLLYPPSLEVPQLKAQIHAYGENFKNENLLTIIQSQVIVANDYSWWINRYFLNVLVDCTLGVGILFLVLKVLSMVEDRLGALSAIINIIFI